MTGDMDKRAGQEPIEYLLGDLSDDERAAFEARLREDRQLRDEVSDAESLFSALRSMPEDAWSPEEPPPLALPINGRDPRADEPGSDPPRAARRPRWAVGWRIPAFATGAVALLLAGLAAGSLLGDDATSPSAPAAEVVSTTDLKPESKAGSGSRGSAQVIRSADGEQRLTVSVADMPETVRGRYYELWLMDGPEKLISLGGFSVGSAGTRSVEVPLPVNPADFRQIDISLERADGDPGHSAVSVLRGPA